MDSTDRRTRNPSWTRPRFTGETLHEVGNELPNCLAGPIQNEKESPMLATFLSAERGMRLATATAVSASSPSSACPISAMCRVQMDFVRPRTSLAFRISSLAKSEVVVESALAERLDKPPVYLPSRILLTVCPGFVRLHETHHLEFEETWRDTCLLLGAPVLRGPREATADGLMEPLEKQLGGRVVLDSNGRFHLRPFGAGKLEMPLVAEGWRKLSMLVRPISTGSLLDQGCLFWDEPEANLNLSPIREMAFAILGICKAGVQVFVATHSLFLLRELELLLEHTEFAQVKKRFFTLNRIDDGVNVSQANEIGDVDPLQLLDEDLIQSDRFIDQFAPNAETPN